jgi:hypothetical protein
VYRGLLSDAAQDDDELHADRAESGFARQHVWPGPYSTPVEAGSGRVLGQIVRFRITRSTPFARPDHANALRSGGDGPGLQFHGRSWNLSSAQGLGHFVLDRERPQGINRVGTNWDNLSQSYRTGGKLDQ